MKRIVEFLKTVIRVIWGGAIDVLAKQAEVVGKFILAIALLIIAVSYCSDVRVDKVQDKRLDKLEAIENIVQE